MEAALANLRQARAHVVRATPDKGGYRTAALVDIDRAIADVEVGIRYDRRHPDNVKRMN
jgi:hypothetical protein